MERKRCRELSSPTGASPRQIDKRAYKVKGKKKLVFSSEVTDHYPRTVGKWTVAEDKALVDYILLTGPGSSWPNTINERYWLSAALFVHQQCCVPKRTCKYTL